MDKTLKTLGISEEFTRAVKKQKVFNKVKSKYNRNIKNQ